MVPVERGVGKFRRTKKPRDIRFVEGAYALTKALDETRPCVDVSGGYHGRHTDLFDFHCYHTAEEIAEYLKANQSPPIVPRRPVVKEQTVCVSFV